MGELSEAEKLRSIETFQSAPPLGTSFPITLPNGVSVPTPRSVCSRCKQLIDPSDVHGRVSWPIQTVAVVDAAGLCRPCSVMTQLHVRFRSVDDTFRAEARRPDRGGWVAVQPPPLSTWQRLRRWLVQQLSR
jgi:hypothetical protein